MIRLAESRDLPGIVAIYNEAIAQRFATADLTPVTPEQRMDWFRAHPPTELPIYVFEQDGDVLGWCSLSAYRPGRAALTGTVEISYYVALRARRRGVGRALVVHTMAEARRLGKRVVFGIVLERNAASINLLSKLGFERWGRLPDVARIDGEDVSHVYYGTKL